MLETEILFDDVAELEAKVSEGYSIFSPVKNDCDCSSYTDTQDDERTGSPKIS